jgi:hypothetical protein
MNYDDFLHTWNEALRMARLFQPGLYPQESIELRSMDRTWHGFIPVASRNSAPGDPFYVTVEVSWRWDALLAARFATTEEDFLTQVYRDHAGHENTQPPWLRIDFTFHATLPMGQPAPLPLPESWRKWASAVNTQIPASFAHEFEEESYDHVLFWCGEPTVDATCSSTGQFYLSGVSLSAWKGITLPRQWDDPERLGEDEPFDQLVKLFTWIRENAQYWGKSLKALSSDQKA